MTSVGVENSLGATRYGNAPVSYVLPCEDGRKGAWRRRILHETNGMKGPWTCGVKDLVGCWRAFVGLSVPKDDMESCSWTSH